MRTKAWLTVLTSLWVAMVAFAAYAAVTLRPTPHPSYYTEAQARTGIYAYSQHCSSCHGANLLLVDLSLPGMSGVGLVKTLRESRPELRCLVVTGHTDPIYREAAESAGAVGYVTKDDPNDILAAVYEVLEQR